MMAILRAILENLAVRCGAVSADTHSPGWAHGLPHGVDSYARSETTAVLARSRIEVSHDGPSGSTNKTETVYLGVCLFAILLK